MFKQPFIFFCVVVFVSETFSSFMCGAKSSLLISCAEQSMKALFHVWSKFSILPFGQIFKTNYKTTYILGLNMKNVTILRKKKNILSKGTFKIKKTSVEPRNGSQYFLCVPAVYPYSRPAVPERGFLGTFGMFWTNIHVFLVKKTISNLSVFASL